MCETKPHYFIRRRVQITQPSPTPFKGEGRTMAQAFAVNFYHSRQWAQVRDYVMMRDRYTCKHCGRPAQEVHHKIHLTKENIYDPKITLNPDNLEALCRDCHFHQHQIDEGRTMCERGYEFDETGQLVPSRTQNIFEPPR